MFSEKDFERLWFLYKTEGEPNEVYHIEIFIKKMQFMKKDLF